MKDEASFKKAFARLDKAREVLETLLTQDKAAVQALHHVLQAEVHTREGAGELLGVDAQPMTETHLLVEEASKASRRGVWEPLEAVLHWFFNVFFQ